MRTLDPVGVVSACSEALGLHQPYDVETLLRPAIRRAAFLLAPCSAVDLVRFVADPLAFLGDYKEATQRTLEEMIAYGDILEMHRLDSDPWGTPPVVLRPAPPTFVVRSPTEVFVIGVSGDMPGPLTADLTAELQVEGPVRVLRSGTAALTAHLKLLGLIELSEHAWLRTPPQEPAGAFVADWHGRLEAVTRHPALIEGLDLLDSVRVNSFYPDRWRSPKVTDSGKFVARRPQAYGDKRWCIVELAQGVTQRVLDFISGDGFERPCDLAWRLQAAIDALNGAPQKVTVRQTQEGAALEFYSPLPSFAERRLALVANKSKVRGALFQFQLPQARLAAELAALQSAMWMQASHEGGLQ